ncbi:MAG: hypothetical protein C5B59_08660 [Bacteroidetes bacterium]|nr:MAG: hypothetical protein C5B59_08660 [Bacteroidota bacterium]
MKFLATLALFAVFITSACAPKQKLNTHPEKKYSTHRLTFVDKNGEAEGYCTGTVIGPHAVLTASHCNDNDVDTVIQFDLALRNYDILAAAHDGRDHVIYLLDGPALIGDSPVIEEKAKVGDTVYMYGNGGRAIEPVERVGHVIDGYVSGSDERDGLTYFDFPVIPGDSGSAIYDQKGNIVSILTYSVNKHSAGFALDFTPEQIKTARTFDPADLLKK